MIKCDKCGKEILSKIDICDDCQTDYENDIDAKTPCFADEYNNSATDILARDTIQSALNFAYRFKKGSCMGLTIIYDGGRYNISNDEGAEAQGMTIDDAKQMLFDYYKTHFDCDNQTALNVKLINKVLNNLRQLDLFNTKLIYGAYELGYLTDDYDTISIQAEDTSSDDRGTEIVDNSVLHLSNNETILLHIRVIAKSYNKLDRILLVFDSIKTEFKKQFQVKCKKVR